MSPETILAGVAATVVILGLIGSFWPKRKPPHMVFKCGRCNTASRHSNRTIEAWRRGKTRFFCPPCHLKWLQSQPLREHDTYAGHGRSGGSGCLGVFVVLGFLPAGGMLAWAFV
ncbi:hypothetical protein [Stenotrophomonas sp. CFBP8980]|uniref:hypothetical protein n=1 Tax=Stenotrophomonas sp. CFBP8980 TaxID=3096523 RepID=UPI002A6A3863|nr:hypothetical protein [Stenotrophomonas sp. CFBP8980]MDY1033262.1 hypothetical protein [Stenotrophomonas sp. CFBP8980]